MSSSGWDNFWKDQRQSFYAVMRIATGFFAAQLEKKYPIKQTDEILDYGCGPGFVADALAAKNISITGVDINDFFIEECRKNHPVSTFIHISTDIAENEKILSDHLKERKFDYIILLSVAQYFKSTGELEGIINLLRHFLKENGRIVIADVIDDSTSSVRDAIALFFHCVKKGRIGAFVGFISYLLFSDYRQISKKIKLLHVPEQVIQQVANNNSLHYKKVSGLTIHPTRSNYVLSNIRQS